MTDPRNPITPGADDPLSIAKPPSTTPIATTPTPQTTPEVDFAPAPQLDAAGDVEFDAADEVTKRTTAETLKEEASKLGSQAADRARSFAGDGKAKASGALDEFSRMMNDAAGTVDEKLGEQYGQYARSAAQSIGGFADTLRTKEVDELLDDARQFVRNSPAMAIGTAAALGFVLARIIKAGVDGVADAGDTTLDRTGTGPRA